MQTFSYELEGFQKCKPLENFINIPCMYQAKKENEYINMLSRFIQRVTTLDSLFAFLFTSSFWKRGDSERKEFVIWEQCFSFSCLLNLNREAEASIRVTALSSVSFYLRLESSFNFEIETKEFEQRRGEWLLKMKFSLTHMYQTRASQPLHARFLIWDKNVDKIMLRLQKKTSKSLRCLTTFKNTSWDQSISNFRGLMLGKTNKVL